MGELSSCAPDVRISAFELTPQETSDDADAAWTSPKQCRPGYYGSRWPAQASGGLRIDDQVTAIRASSGRDDQVRARRADTHSFFAEQGLSAVEALQMQPRQRPAPPPPEDARGAEPKHPTGKEEGRIEAGWPTERFAKREQRHANRETTDEAERAQPIEARVCATVHRSDGREIVARQDLYGQRIACRRFVAIDH